jgi:hypothetical protein
VSVRRLKVRFGAAAVIALAALGICATSASAGILVASAPSCDEQVTSQPFKTQFGDNAYYTLVRGGNFEASTAGWTLSGGASVTSGNESFNVGGASDARSLSLPYGSSATSATICVGIEHPTIRFFTKRHTAGLFGLSVLKVDVLVELFTGDVVTLPIGVIANANSWSATLPTLAIANLLPLLPGERTAIALKFTPILGGDWSIDDVYVDPYGRN